MLQRLAGAVGLALAMAAASGCGAIQMTPVFPAGSGGLVPRAPDANAGLTAMAPGVDLQGYTVLLVDRFVVRAADLTSEEDRRLATVLPQYLQSEMVMRVRAAGLFDRVVNLSEAPSFTAPSGTRALRLEGVVTELTPGSRAARYLIGFGAGAAKAQLETRFVDAATGAVVLVTADRREAMFGIFGGDSEDHLREAMSDSARDLARFLARTRPASAPTVAGGGAAATTPDTIAGIWRETSADRSMLRIGARGNALDWEYEDTTGRLSAGTGTAPTRYVATGDGTASGDDVVLSGTIRAGHGFSLNKPLQFTLRRDGDRLRGTATGPRNVPYAIEFERAR